MEMVSNDGTWQGLQGSSDEILARAVFTALVSKCSVQASKQSKNNTQRADKEASIVAGKRPGLHGRCGFGIFAGAKDKSTIEP
ncbi:MAG: hypothetical protein NT025_09430 [bacterium]|nr:hypothetical protein [bacterium]